MRRIRHLILFVAALTLAVLPAARAAEPEDESVPRYTDEDLKDPKGKSPQSRSTQADKPSAGKAAPPPASNDPRWAEQWKHDQERRAYWDRKVRAAEEKVAELERTLEYLGRKRSAIQNPLMPRPELRPEDREEEAGMDGVSLLARAEAQIQETRKNLDAARRSVVEIRLQARISLQAAKVRPGNPR